MDSLLQGLEGVSIYINDIFITGSSIDPKASFYDLVLSTYDEEGLHPTEEKVKVIQEAPTLKNVAELQSFLGINYYSRFLPNLSTRLAPLYRLLHKDVKFCWNEDQDEAFKAVKEALQSDSLLVHYHDTKPLILA